MPENYEMYYGFTRFAIELNELDQETAKHIPKTDTRFRPDQRYLFDTTGIWYGFLYSFVSMLD